MTMTRDKIEELKQEIETQKAHDANWIVVELSVMGYLLALAERALEPQGQPLPELPPMPNPSHTRQVGDEFYFTGGYSAAQMDSYAHECIRAYASQLALPAAQPLRHCACAGQGKCVPGCDELPAGPVPEGWKDAIESVRKRMENDTPSAYDNSGYREYAGVILDAVEDQLHALASPSPAVAQPVADERDLRTMLEHVEEVLDNAIARDCITYPELRQLRNRVREAINRAALGQPAEEGGKA